MLLGTLFVVLEAARILLVHLEACAGICVGILIVGVVEQLRLLLGAILSDGCVAVQFALACRGFARHLD